MKQALWNEVILKRERETAISNPGGVNGKSMFLDKKFYLCDKVKCSGLTPAGSSAVEWQEKEKVS